MKRSPFGRGYVPRLYKRGVPGDSREGRFVMGQKTLDHKTYSVLRTEAFITNRARIGYDFAVPWHV
jgi:hypothetical protein